MEMKFFPFIVQHNLSLSLSENVVELLRSFFPNDAALKKATLGKQGDKYYPSSTWVSLSRRNGVIAAITRV